MNPNDSQIQQAAAVFNAIAEALEDTVAPIITETGLPQSQIRVLYQLHYQKDASIGQIAQNLDVGLPTASYHVEQLVKAGLVERAESKADRRTKVISLTPKGQTLTNRFVQRPLDQMTAWLAQLAPDDLALFLQGLQALAKVSGTLSE